MTDDHGRREPAASPAESRGDAPGRNRLEGRRILVVGAGQDDAGLDEAPIGNGRAISVLFGREGAVIAAADRHLDSGRDTARLVSDAGGSCEALAADVSRPESIAAMVAKAAELLGGLDGVVFNVGIGEALGLAATTAESWDRVFSVNLRGAMLTAQSALPLLGDHSTFVFVSSIAALRPGSRIPSYDSSKSGLIALSRHVAMEGAPRGIRSNVIAPGLMDTPIGRRATLARPGRASQPVPLGRSGTGWETAYAALFLTGNESAYITGQTLVVDGGLTGIR